MVRQVAGSRQGEIDLSRAKAPQYFQVQEQVRRTPPSGIPVTCSGLGFLAYPIPPSGHKDSTNYTQGSEEERNQSTHRSKTRFLIVVILPISMSPYTHLCLHALGHR